MKTRLTIWVCGWLATSAFAAVSFGPAQNFPRLGLAFPLPDRAAADPLPMPEATPFLVAIGEELTREDRFDPFELWRGQQSCGRWRGPNGQRLEVARLAGRLPLFSEDSVSRARFAAACADDANQLDPDKAEHVDEWVATFVDGDVFEAEPLKLNAFALDALRHYPCAASNTLVYAFRPRQLGGATDPGWFCVLFEAPGEAAGLARIRSRFEEQFLGRIALPGRGSKDEGAAAEALELKQRGRKTFDLPDHPVRAEARRSIENYDGWWYADTDGYIILSDVATEVGQSVIRELQDTMPALQRAYARLLPPLTRQREVALIRIFQKRDDYVRHVGADHAWTGAAWMPARGELVLTQELNKDEMMRMIRHEAFHQYLSHAYCMIAAAPWLNEGHACLFESAHVDAKGNVTLEEDPARCQLLLDNLEKVVAAIPSLLKADYETFYTGETLSRPLRYAAVWGLAYYLQKGAPLERNTPFKTLLPDVAAALAETHSYRAATEAALEKVDLAVFQENFREFWLKRRAAAIQYDPLAE